MDLWWSDHITPPSPTNLMNIDAFHWINCHHLLHKSFGLANATHSQIGGKKKRHPWWRELCDEKFAYKTEMFETYTLLVSLMTCQVDIVFIWNTAAHRNFHSVTWHGPIHLDHLEILDKGFQVWTLVDFEDLRLFLLTRPLPTTSSISSLTLLLANNRLSA